MQRVAASLGSAGGQGAVAVLYNSRDRQSTGVGLTAEHDQLWTQASLGISDDPADVDSANDGFGFQLTAADYGFTRQDDLAVGVPFEDLGPIIDAGAVNVIYGTPDGLRATGDQFLSQDGDGIKGHAAAHDSFGILWGGF